MARKLGIRILNGDEKLGRFEQLILPHIHAAYNLARRLTASDDDAHDAVQEAYLRAYKFFDAFHGDNGRVWLLTIVRNTCYTQHRQARHSRTNEEFDEEMHGPAAAPAGAFVATPPDPQTQAQRQSERVLVQRAIDDLPRDYREVLVLREIEDLSYKEIAAIAGVPMGTVMSRLARARALLQQRLQPLFAEGVEK